MYTLRVMTLKTCDPMAVSTLMMLDALWQVSKAQIKPSIHWISAKFHTRNWRESVWFNPRTH